MRTYETRVALMALALAIFGWGLYLGSLIGERTAMARFGDDQTMATKLEIENGRGN